MQNMAQKPNLYIVYMYMETFYGFTPSNCNWFVRSAKFCDCLSSHRMWLSAKTDLWLFDQNITQKCCNNPKLLNIGYHDLNVLWKVIIGIIIHQLNGYYIACKWKIIKTIFFLNF